MTVHEAPFGRGIGRVSRPRRDDHLIRAVQFWRWSPRELENRGARVGREQTRAFGDLQAAASAAEWRG